MPLLLVIPSIDISEGKTVRVVQGIPELNCPEYDNDPLEMAMIWRAENAKMLHLVDFDASASHSHSNFELIKSICESVIIPIEYAGGIRTLEDADRLFDLGVARIAISTILVEDRAEAAKILAKYGPKKVISCLDAINDEIVVRRRRIRTGIDPIQFAIELKNMGFERIIVTDVLRNGMIQGPNINFSKRIAAATGCKITHSGGVRNKDELMDLQALLGDGIDSVIIGRALYENRFPCQKLWRIAESGLFS
ncbi:MAG: 1-(5-phosphoribosyl)-5-[(5-phosphoribosylamino)methylideneamino] imidazole-4-carboxamide isomerase [Ignavibacteriaceae bacterium]|nr:1-(5-phosphoribosyl)-5-[(5-phosphoribosylamino)methylideneamino] imidazole-4-carboxamide isomerase [Ignavibacteriaceae bacterium]